MVSLRGYDRDEVHAFLGRVAEQLGETEARATQLQQRLDRLKAQQPSIAATAEPAPAAQQAASPEPSSMFAEVGKETQRILEAAQEAGQQIQRKARQEVDRDLKSARGQAAKLIAEGERRREHIERIVAEMEQRRAAMSVQLRDISRTIEQTLTELGQSDSAFTVRQATGPDSPDTAASPAAAAQEELAGEGEAPPLEPAEPARQVLESVAQGGAQALTEEAPAAPAPPGSDENAPEDSPPEPALGPDEASRPATGAPVQPGAEEGPDTPVSTQHSAATEPAITAETSPAAPEAEAPSDPQGLRAAALSPLHPKLVRKVKRELQEIQNIALDRVRRAKGGGEAGDFLPRDEDTSGLGEGSAELLEQAWRAGVGSAGVLADRDLGTPAGIPDLADVFLRDASDRVRSGLSSTLRMGLSANEAAQGLSDRIGAAFSEFKGAQAEELAATHLIRAYEQGLLAAWSAGGIDGRRWVLGREPRCPEARCRTNDKGGDVPVGEPFPSGHDVPPVHVGCTCTTIPAGGARS
ncbi:MAG: DivIVA domain-containing protein [Nitriliruptorales bacterium]|nr:DivIVA domain-containing protein [Nitriliruptorales bacterium]